MAQKRFTPEQVVAKRREAERLQGQGMTIPQLCKRIGVSDQTFFRWRIRYGALKEDEAQRLRQLELEKLAVETDRGRAGTRDPGLEGAGAGKMVGPATRRAAFDYVLAKYPQVSERQACLVVGQHRSTQRYQVKRRSGDDQLIATLRRLSEKHPYWGYKSAHRELRRRGWLVNRKRVERVWRECELRARPPRRAGRRAIGGAQNAIRTLPAEHPNHV